VDGSKVDPIKIRELLQKLEFRSLLRQLPEVMHVQEEHEQHSNVAERHFAVGRNVLITSDADLQKLNLNNPTELFVHARSAGKHGRNPQVLMVSTNGKTTYTIDLQKVSVEMVQGVLGELFENEAIQKIGYDIKSTIKALYTLGITLNGVGHDVLIGAFLLNSLRREQTLTELAQSDIGYDGAPLEDMPTEELTERAAEVMSAVVGLYHQQFADLKEMPKVAELAQTIEWPVIPVLAAMEYEGIHLDTEYLKRFSVEIEDSISDLEQEIYGHAETEFNIGSPAQLADILFVKLNLPTQGIKKGKTSYSTAATELDKLRGLHPIIDLITQWREVTKLKNTYVDTLPLMVDENSRVHTTYSLTVAQTGRLSSNDPNLQNIPVRTELGKRIRTAFIAGPGKVFISADYSQFELRLAAYLAGDQELIEMFNAGADIHTMTAAQVHGRQPDEISKQMRREAKVINFGVLYGMSPHGLSIAAGMSVMAAKAYIDKYFQLRKPLLDYMNSLKEKARSDGYVETLFGRRRWMPDIKSSNFIVRQAAERAAINMPIQGTEADLMKMAMITVQNRLADEYPTARQLLQVHDSILIEADDADAESVAKMLKETMQNVYKLPVRLDVDVTTAKNWGDL
jgi:DNA polymerase-1